MMRPATNAAKPIEADCTAELRVMKVPRKRGSTADEIIAMPGIMRPLMTVNNKVDMVSKPHSGRPCDKVVAIKGLCREANAAKIDVGPKGPVASFRNDTYANPRALMQFVAKNNIVWKVRPDQKVVVKGEWDTPAARLDAAEKILTQLVKLAKE